jgi:hypothetical protein
MSTSALLEARITQLETGTELPTPSAGPRPATALLLVSAAAWSAIIIAHYMPVCVPGLG